jgi:hypothetical protein
MALREHDMRRETFPATPQQRADLLLRNDWATRQRMRDPRETVLLCNGCGLARETDREWCVNCDEITDSYPAAGGCA